MEFGSQATGVPANILAAVGVAESGFDSKAVSKAGAIGTYQFMPETAAGMGFDPHDPVQSVVGAGVYLRNLHNKFGSWPLAFAAYNAGEGAVEKYGGIPPFPETQQYVERIMSMLGGKA